jgi:hypothetical protein
MVPTKCGYVVYEPKVHMATIYCTLETLQFHSRRFKQMPRCNEAPLGMRSIRSILSPLSADLPPVKPTYLQDFHILTTINLEGHVFYLYNFSKI